MFFEPEFLSELTAMGTRDARLWLDHGPAADDPWQLEPLKAFTDSDRDVVYRPSGTGHS